MNKFIDKNLFIKNSSNTLKNGCDTAKKKILHQKFTKIRQNSSNTEFNSCSTANLVE